MLVSNRWDVGDGGEIGVLVNAAMTNIDFLDSTRENDRFVSPRPATAELSGIHRARTAAGCFTARRSLAAVVQRGDPVRANPDLQFYIDGLFQGYRGNDSKYWHVRAELRQFDL